jgi:hypothetical protein
MKFGNIQFHKSRSSLSSANLTKYVWRIWPYACDISFSPERILCGDPFAGNCCKITTLASSWVLLMRALKGESCFRILSFMQEVLFTVILCLVSGKWNSSHMISRCGQSPRTVSKLFKLLFSVAWPPFWPAGKGLSWISTFSNKLSWGHVWVFDV